MEPRFGQLLQLNQQWLDRADPALAAMFTYRVMYLAPGRINGWFSGIVIRDLSEPPVRSDAGKVFNTFALDSFEATSE